jgi:hypothetical protein
MKISSHLSSTCVLVSALVLTPAFAGNDHTVGPKHGGLVSESNHIEYELVLKPDATEIHVRDHGKVKDMSKAKAKINVLSEGKKLEQTLSGEPAMLKGPALGLGAQNYTAVATVEFASGKKATVRFKAEPKPKQ